ncbi:MAG: hypothetical protein IRZ06_12545 [Nevskia sp.]|nr:hypothetical protein [Nevskia sp.]MBX6421817.1 hypothetical protein [Nevskia sp.]
MKPAKALVWTLIPLAALVTAGEFAAHDALTRRIAALRVQQQPWLRLRVGREWIWPWGAAQLDDVRLAPQDWYNAVWQLPLGYEVQIAQVVIDRPRWHLGGAQRGALVSFDLHVRGLRLPVPERWGWSYTLGAPGDPLARPPSLYELGYRELEAEADLRLQPAPLQHRLRVDGAVRVADLGDFDTRCTLEAGSEVLDGDTRRLGLRDCRLSYRDRGAVARWQRALAQRAGLSEPQFEDWLAKRFRDWVRTAALPLDTGSLAAFDDFLRAPHAAVLTSAPDAAVPFDALRASPPAAWVRMLGLRLRPRASDW